MKLAMYICTIFTTVALLIWSTAAYLLKDEVLMHAVSAPMAIGALLTIALYKLIPTHSQ